MQEEEITPASFEELVQLIAERHRAEIEATIMAQEIPLLPVYNLDDIRAKAMYHKIWRGDFLTVGCREMFEECKMKSRPNVKFNFYQSEFYQRIISHQCV